MSRIGDAEVFVAVVDAGGFTPAAVALGLSQPAVSRRVAGLEARLGVRLLARTTRRIRPTDAGRMFYERCRRALAELEEAECEAAAQGADLRGVLRLAAPPAFGRAVLMTHLAAFSTAHPAISIDLRLGERQLDLREEAVDLAVRLGDPGRAPGLIRTRLGEFRLVACAAAAYLEVRGAPRTAADLVRHACVVQAGATVRDLWTLFPQVGRPRAGHRVASRPRLRAHCAATTSRASPSPRAPEWASPSCPTSSSRTISAAVACAGSCRVSTPAASPSTPSTPNAVTFPQESARCSTSWSRACGPCIGMPAEVWATSR